MKSCVEIDRGPTQAAIDPAPRAIASTQALKEISPYQFEWWAVDLVNARPTKDHVKGPPTSLN